LILAVDLLFRNCEENAHFNAPCMYIAVNLHVRRLPSVNQSEGTRFLSLISDNSMEFQVVNVMYRYTHRYIHTHMIRHKVDILRYRLVKRESLWWTHVTD